MKALLLAALRCAGCRTWLMVCDHGDCLTVTCPNQECQHFGRHYGLPQVELEPAQVTHPYWLARAR
jgi:hypothetical protein